MILYAYELEIQLLFYNTRKLMIDNNINENYILFQIDSDRSDRTDVT